MSKYHSRKITLDGQTFDSKKEYARWCDLKLLERVGKIRDLQRQVKFVLIPAQFESVWDDRRKQFGKSKCIERECAYMADFVYTDMKTGLTTVEDTKGFKTKDYIIKRKLMLWVHGIRIHEV